MNTLAPCTRRTAEVFTFKIDYEYAVFTIHHGGPNYYGLMIESSFGSYSYVWTQPGDVFYDFIAQLDLSYLLSKMVVGDDEFDCEATVCAIREEIIELRRNKFCTAEQAREEWDETDLIEDGGYETFVYWVGNTDLFRDNEPWTFQRSCGGQYTRGFINLYNKFWPSFSAEMCRYSTEIQASPTPSEMDEDLKAVNEVLLPNLDQSNGGWIRAAAMRGPLITLLRNNRAIGSKRTWERVLEFAGFYINQVKMMQPPLNHDRIGQLAISSIEAILKEARRVTGEPKFSDR